MRTSKDNYEFNDSMRFRTGWVPVQLEGPRTEEKTRTMKDQNSRRDKDKRRKEDQDRAGQRT